MTGLSALLLLLSIAFGARAQSLHGTIAGTVTDPSGKPLGEARVRLSEVETGRERTTTAAHSGEFRIPLLPAGRYRLAVEQPGYQSRSMELALLINQEIRVEVPMLPAGRAESIEVRAPRSLLRPESAATGAVIENHQVRGLPLDGRNFLELTLLTPGVAPAAQGSAGSVRGSFAVNVNGARESSNMYLLDGVYNGDPKLNGTGLSSSADAIRESEMSTSTYDASFGRNGGGQVNVAVKSGTNELHGTAYYFFRNSVLDARNFFVPAGEPDPRYQRNQFGFSAGGPLARNRTFLFGNYEGRRIAEGITKVSNVPTALERTGDFSQSGLRYLIDPFTMQPFPGNRVPANRIHPAGNNIVNLYPLPNRNVPGQNYVSSPVQRDRNDQFDVRLDHQLTASGDFAARYSMSDRGLYEPFSGPSFAAIPGFGTGVPLRSHNFMLSEIHAITPAFLNELRAGFSRVSGSSLQENIDQNLNRMVGLPSLSDNPRRYGLSFMTLPGYSSLGDEFNNPQQSATNVYQVLDNATWLRGPSLCKFGFEFRRTQQNAFRDVQSRGFLNFLGLTGNSVAELLQGLPSYTGGAILDNPQYLRTSSYNFFVNDNWRVVPRLTLNLGLRYEYNSPPVDRYDRANVYDLAQGRLVPVGVGGVPRGGFLPDRNNFAPRLGLAWTVGSDERTVVRAGYGFYYDQSPLAPGEGLYFSPPYFNFRLFYSLPQFPLTLDNPWPSNFPFPTPPSALAFQRDLRSAYMQHWNFGIQRQVGRSGVVEGGYVASKGTKLLSARDINQPAPSAAQFNPRPNPYFDDISALESRASSSYQSLQARYQRGFAAGISALVGYTWAKSIDDSSNFFSSAGDPNFPQDSYNVSAERGRSNFDVRHRLTASYSWELPFGRGKRWLSEGAAARIAGGWQTFGIWTFQTGRPFTVALLPELDNSGTGRSVLGFGANDRPDVLRNPALPDPAPERWFDTTAFTIPARGNFGNAGRNILDGPGLRSINVSLLRNFSLRESLSLQFRAEAFNLLNNVNFDLPDIFAGSPAFGRISSAQAPRHIQFGLKLLF